MVLGLENIKGLGFLDNINGSGILGKVSAFAQFMFIAVVGATLIGLYFYWKNDKDSYNKTIHIFETVNHQLIHIRDEMAREIVIPLTTVRVFFLKHSKIYLPRGTRQMGKDHFWYAIRRNREWVNFTLKDLDKEMKEVGLDYDHTDMTYANANLKKLIDNNYNKEKWWVTFRNEIGLTILIVMLTFSFWFLFGKLGSIIGSLTPLIEAMKEVAILLKEILGNMDNVCSTSGVIQAG